MTCPASWKTRFGRWRTDSMAAGPIGVSANDPVQTRSPARTTARPPMTATLATARGSVVTVVTVPAGAARAALPSADADWLVELVASLSADERGRLADLLRDRDG